MAHVSTKPGADTVYYEAGSPEVTADLINAQDRARSNPATVAKNWTPWVACCTSRCAIEQDSCCFVSRSLFLEES